MMHQFHTFGMKDTINQGESTDANTKLALAFASFLWTLLLFILVRSPEFPPYDFAHKKMLTEGLALHPASLAPKVERLLVSSVSLAPIPPYSFLKSKD